MTPLTLIQELTEEEIQPHPKEDCHPSGQGVHKDSRSNLKTFFSSTISSDVMRKASKPSRTLKQGLENMDAFASNWGKGGKEVLRDSGVEASSIEYSQHHDISQISSEDTF